MNSTKETILTRWHELSMASKALLSEKQPLKLNNQAESLSLLSDLSRLISQAAIDNGLIITRHISDAIFLQSIFEVANPDLKTQLVLPHYDSLEITPQEGVITITPFPLFSLQKMREQPLNLLEFKAILVDESISSEYIHDLFFTNQDNNLARFAEEEQAEISFLTTDFETLCQTVAKNIPDQVKETTEKPAAKTAKISLKTKSEASPEEKSSVQVENTDVKSDTNDQTSTKKIQSTKRTKNDIKNDKVQTLTLEDAKSEPQKLIAMVPRNLQRQYIRDYIREHNLEHILIVTHNRQSARLLEKYLYRARIRSRIVHEKIDDDTATSLFDRYNNGQFTALILMHRVVQDFASKIQNCDAVIFLDFPPVYAEFAERLEFVANTFKPQHFIAIASENDRAWVQVLFEEYPALDLPIVEVDITPPKRKNQPDNNQRDNDKRHADRRDNKRHPKNRRQNPKADETEASADNTADVKTDIHAKNTSETSSVVSNATSDQATDNQQTSEEKQRGRRNNNRRNQRQNRNERSNEPHNRRNNNDRRDHQPRNNHRNRGDQQPDHHEMGDSQSDFFSNNHDEIVNKNRLPFESGSFEANIARENRRRGRDPFSGVPGGLGQSSGGNFIQNLTQGLNPNQNSDPQSQNRRNNRTNNRQRPRGRKK